LLVSSLTAEEIGVEIFEIVTHLKRAHARAKTLEISSALRILSPFLSELASSTLQNGSTATETCCLKFQIRQPFNLKRASPLQNLHTPPATHASSTP
jgi:hypothetical protein